MDPQVEAFIKQNQASAMTTQRPDGTAHTVRIGVGIVDGKLWSSGTQTRVRTRHLRRDSRSTLFVFDNQFRWLSLECRVTILDSPDAPQLNLRLMQEFQRDMVSEPGRVNWFGRQLTLDEFFHTMREEQRLIYEFDILRAYGMYGGTPASS